MFLETTDDKYSNNWMTGIEIGDTWINMERNSISIQFWFQCHKSFVFRLLLVLFFFSSLYLSFIHCKSIRFSLKVNNIQVYAESLSVVSFIWSDRIECEWKYLSCYHLCQTKIAAFLCVFVCARKIMKIVICYNWYLVRKLCGDANFRHFRFLFVESMELAIKYQIYEIVYMVSTLDFFRRNVLKTENLVQNVSLMSTWVNH